MIPLAKSILTTLAFFDAQDLPLTLFEVKNYLTMAAELPEIERALQTELAPKVGCVDGFYFLRGRDELATSRHRRYRVSLERFRKSQRFLRLLRFFPYLRAVAVSGSQALLGSRESSDIDLFVVVRPGRIWLARLFVSFYFQLMGVRRQGRLIRGRFCLNHYICTDRVMDQDRNLYTAIEYASLLPILGAEHLQKFWSQNREWMKDFLPQATLQAGGIFPGFQFSVWQKSFEVALDVLGASLWNDLARGYQKQRIRREEHILISDVELSFHPGSRGQKVLERFQAMIKTPS